MVENGAHDGRKMVGMGHMMEEGENGAHDGRKNGAHDGRKMVGMGHMMEEGWLEWGT